MTNSEMAAKAFKNFEDALEDPELSSEELREIYESTKSLLMQQAMLHDYVVKKVLDLANKTEL